MSKQPKAQQSFLNQLVVMVVVVKFLQKTTKKRRGRRPGGKGGGGGTKCGGVGDGKVLQKHKLKISSSKI